MKTFAPVVYDDLASPEVGVSERWGHTDNRPQPEVLRQIAGCDDALQKGQPEGEETCVGRHHRRCAQPLRGAAGHEEMDCQVLTRKPLQRLIPQGTEVRPQTLSEARLVCGQLVPDQHAVRVATPHVGVRVVGREAVAYPADPGFNVPPLSREVVGYLVPPVRRPPAGGVAEVFQCLGHEETRAPTKHPLEVLWQLHRDIRMSTGHTTSSFDWPTPPRHGASQDDARAAGQSDCSTQCAWVRTHGAVAGPHCRRRPCPKSRRMRGARAHQGDPHHRCSSAPPCPRDHFAGPYGRGVRHPRTHGQRKRPKPFGRRLRPSVSLGARRGLRVILAAL